MAKINLKWIHFGLFVITSILSNQSFAGVKFTLSGSQSLSNVTYEVIESRSGSAGVSLDLGEYFRIGVTHRQELARTSGYHLKSGSTTDYIYFESSSKITANSADLTLVLYAGDIFTPYIFAGVVVKYYLTNVTEADGTTQHLDESMTGPQGGLGLAIQLNQKFSLKLNYTLSQGVKAVPGQKAVATVDAATQVGIQYSL